MAKRLFDLVLRCMSFDHVKQLLVFFDGHPATLRDIAKVGVTPHRQAVPRFARMTMSFSKSVLMHEACLLLFLSRYNLDQAILLK